MPALTGFKNFLQGKWLGHPLHPAIVHLPAGLWPAALILDLLSRPGGRAEMLATASSWCIAVGLIAALGAVPTGLADWWEIKPEKPAYRLGLWHLGINLAVVLLFAINLFVRWNRGWPEGTDWTVIVLSAVGVVLLAVSGYLGGRMVFDQGVGVARQSKKQWRRIAEAGGANLPPES